MKKFLLALFVFALFATTLPSSAQSSAPATHLVISQIYGGGGNSGGVYANDFIELFNPTDAAIGTNGLFVQYAPSTGSFSSSTGSANNFALPDSTIPAHGYFLIEAAPGSNTSETALPTPDATATGIAISGTTGKVALVSTLVSGTCPIPSASVIDFVGWGTPNCSEGNNPAGATANATAVVRNSPSVDTDNNGNDFQVTAPNPHNSGSVSTPPQTLAISAIQGPRSKTQMMVSPYVGQQVTTEGVVTAVIPSGFFIQSITDDGDPATPEGVLVYTKSRPTSNIVVGAAVTVTGTVSIFPTAYSSTGSIADNANSSHTPSTEIDSPTVTVTGTANLPQPVMLTAADVSPTGSIYQLTPYEGMRIGFASLTAVSGSDGSLNEANETYTSYGEFYAVVTGTPRPFREPGIDLRDTTVDPTKQPAIFNDSPERIYVDSGYATGTTTLNVSTGAVLPNITGVLDFSDTYDDNYYPARFLPDASYSASSITPGMTPQPVAPPNPGEFTVASFNIERFYNTSSSDDLYYVPAGVLGYNGSSNTGTISNGQTFQSEAVDITATAYQTRLKKLSLAIRTILNSPDIVTLEEVENQSVANDIATQINTDAGVDGLYTAYSTDNSTYYSQDGTGISVGFLVKNTVDVNNVTQFGQATPGAPDLADQTFTPSSGNLTTLNDRPWMVLDAGIKRAGGSDYPVTVIVNHMKALTGINAASNSTRLKKELQAEDIAKYIQTLQAAGKHVISGGDFNAYQFSDGYTDTLATYTNTNVLPAAQVVQPGVPGLVTPPLVDMVLNLDANQRWSYSEFGDAEVLDHMVVTPELADGRIVYAHIDADFPVIDYNDATTPARTSDHDPVLGYFPLPSVIAQPPAAPTLSPTSLTFASTPVQATAATQTVTLTNSAATAIPVTFSITGDYKETDTCNGNVPATGNCVVTVSFTPTATGTRTGTLTVNTPSAMPASQTATLTGTGQPLDFTITGPNGSTISQTINAGDTATIPLTFTPTSGSFTITLNCSGPSPAPTGVTCTVPTTPFTIGGKPSTQTVTIQTTSRVASSGFAIFSGQRAPTSWIASVVLGLCGLLMFLVSRTRRLGQYSVRIAGLLALMIAICLPVIGCGGGNHTTTTGPGTNPNGTPAGTYTYTVTANAGNGTTHTQSIVLTVK